MSTENFIVEYEKKILPKKIFTYGLIFAVVGLALIVIAFLNDAVRASFVSVVTFAFVLSIALGAMFMVAIEYVAGAVWSVPFRRIAEFLGAVLFIAPIFIIPAILNFHSIFHWTHQEVVAKDAILQAKAPYLNETFFYVRNIGIFIVWWIFYLLMKKNSMKQDFTGNAKLSKQNTVLSALFLIFLGISITIISIDWLMSLAPHWFSTIFGVYYFSGTVIAGLAAWAFISIKFNEKGYLLKGIKSDHYYSFGALMFAFVNFWAYIAFSQFLLIWYANLPEETFWFIARGEGTWLYFSLGLIFVHLIVPYFMILPQPAKMDPKRLKIVSIWLLFAHFYDLYWLVMPTLDKDGYKFCFLDFSFPIFAIGAIMLIFYFVARNKNLVPLQDPKLKQSLNFRL